MEYHPISNVFPLMEGEAFEALVADIKEYGLREPIMVYKNKILDGRNRFRACEKLGINPDFEYFNGGDPMAFTVSLNLHRRHLTTSQKAMACAELYHWKHGGKRQAENLPVDTQQAIATLFGISDRSIRSAQFVVTNASEAEKQEVRDGRITASDMANRLKKRQQSAEKKAARAASPKRTAQLQEKFARAVNSISSMCRGFAEIACPQLPDTQAVEHLTALKEARKQISTVIKLLEGRIK